MGDPGDPGYEIGDACPAGEEILWDEGETPKKITVFFDGIITCPVGPPHVAPNGYWILTQDVLLPCRWYTSTGIDMIRYEINGGSSLMCGRALFGSYFRASSAGITLEFKNTLHCGPPDFDSGRDGTGKCFLGGSAVPWAFQTKYNFLKDPDTFYDPDETGTGKSMFIFANRKLSMNILVVSDFPPSYPP